MKQVEIFTDGACSGNPGPGGWGAVLRYNGHEKEISGGEVSCDGGEWEKLGEAAVQHKWTQVNLPFVPARHDTLRLRISGTGQIAVRSIAFTFAASRGNRVAGA